MAVGIDLFDTNAEFSLDACAHAGGDAFAPTDDGTISFQCSKSRAAGGHRLNAAVDVLGNGAAVATTAAITPAH